MKAFETIEEKLNIQKGVVLIPNRQVQAVPEITLQICYLFRQRHTALCSFLTDWEVGCVFELGWARDIDLPHGV